MNELIFFLFLIFFFKREGRREREREGEKKVRVTQSHNLFELDAAFFELTSIFDFLK